MPKKRVQAAAYLRVSSPGQATDERDGFPRQRAAVAAYAKAHRVDLVEEFTDAVSGSKGLADRPGLVDLLARIMGNGVRLVLVENAGRLGRDLIESEMTLRKFREQGVRVVAADAGTDLTAGDAENPSAKLIRQILSSVAEWQKDELVLKLRVARQRKRRATGEKIEGRKAFGEKPGEEEHLAHLRQIARKPKGGERLSYREIATTANEAEIPTRSGVPWSAGSVHRILMRSRSRKKA